MNTTTLHKPMLGAMMGLLALFSGGVQAQAPDAPTALDASAVNHDSFTANWEPVIGATNYRLDVSTSPDFGNVAVASDLFISEYVEGTAGYKVIEIYNGTGASVDLSSYTIRRQDNGSDTYTQQLLIGTLANNSTRVIAYGIDIAPEVLAVATQLNSTIGGPLDFDGNDAVALLKNGTPIDIVGVADDAAPWGADVTLRRKISVTGPSMTYSTADWDAYGANDVSGLGSHTMTDFVPSFLPGYENLEVTDAFHIVSGLEQNTMYYYRVRAENPDGTSADSQTIATQTLALPTFGSISQADGVACEESAATFNLTGLTPNSMYAIAFDIGGGTPIIVDEIAVDAFGNASFETVLTLGNDGQTLTVNQIARTDIASEVVDVTAANTVVLDVTEGTVYYADADGDGYGNAEDSVLACSAVAGFVLNDADCDDTSAEVNPDAAEILYNGIDDNCNGQLDEGFLYTTQVRPNQCGSTLASVNSYIEATQLPNVTMYRFEVTDIETSAVQTIERTQQYFSPRMLSSFHYSKTYSVRVMVQRDGVWLGYYGPACLVSTPDVLGPGGAATIVSSQCGGVLPTISSLIYTTSLPGVTGYRFRVTNASDPFAPNQVQEIDRGHLHWFSLSMLENYNYGSTYFVEVAIRTTDDYSDYSSPCSVTAPPVPTLVNCGASIQSENDLVATVSKLRVTMNRFIITNMNTQQTTILDRELHWFRFADVPDYEPGALYSVQVALMTGGHFSLAGPACEIMAPGAARAVVKGEAKQSAPTAVAFSAVAYPNPFSDSFNVKIAGENDAALDIKVYDMTGRLIERQNVLSQDASLARLGEAYPSGVYNVVVTQSDTVKTLRVVKR